MELVIHDSTRKYYPFPLSDPRVTYVHDPEIATVGRKRNRLNSISRGRILVCMDDDDLYYSGYVSECVRLLMATAHPSSFLVRSSDTVMYHLQDNRFKRFSRENTNRCINSAMAYERGFLKDHSYNNGDRSNEEQHFTNRFSCTVANMQSDKVGIHVVHTHNTVNKDGKGYEISSDLIDRYILMDAHSNLPYVYWINLEKRKDRSNTFLKQIGTKILGCRVPAISKEHEVRFDANRTSNSEIACFLSHMKAMRTYLDHPTDHCQHAIVCEDDLLIGNQKLFYEQIFYYVSTAPGDWEILQLHRIVINADIPYSLALRWSAWDPHMFSTAIYIVRRSAAERLVRTFREGLDLTSYGRVVADNTIYSNAVTYSVDMPHFRTNDHFPSDINRRHADLQKKNNRLIRSSSSRHGYPFED
jgi:GR25 family glycosyltransferase involved in LPS biosynthesis